MRKLSEVEFHEIRSTDGWLTSRRGKLGKVADVIVRPYVNGFSIMLKLVWEDGSTSYPYWPTGCGKVTINE